MTTDTARLLPLAFWAALVLVGAVWVVALRSLFRAAMALGLVLVGVAGVFIVLAAEFLGFVQILVYVGAVLTLVIFTVMLTSSADQPAASISAWRQVPAAGVCLALFATLLRATAPLTAAPEAGVSVDAGALARELITTWVLPFEVISLVFVAAMAGAIAVAYAPGRRTPSRP